MRIHAMKYNICFAYQPLGLLCYGFLPYVILRIGILYYKLYCKSQLISLGITVLQTKSYTHALKRVCAATRKSQILHQKNFDLFLMCLIKTNHNGMLQTTPGIFLYQKYNLAESRDYKANRYLSHLGTPYNSHCKMQIEYCQ